MKKILFILLFSWGVSVFGVAPSPEDPNVLVQEMLSELQEKQQKFRVKRQALHFSLSEVNQRLKTAQTLEEKVDLLIQKDQLKEQLAILALSEENETSKIRYIKGLQIIKLLYEKILSLDHHYAGVYTFSEINKMSNPHYFPEFTKVKDLINKKKNRTFSFNFDAQSILGVNPLATATQSFIDLLSIDLSSKNKKEELRNLECIIDFSLSMYNELNTIYFETTYLQSSNQAIKTEIETLFKDYTTPIGYSQSLGECRGNDDWNIVITNLKNYLEKKNNADSPAQKKMLIDLEFSVDRLLQFITVYNDFINEGELFYKKFKTILSSYQNMEQCQSQIPIEYTNLKNEIDNTLEKFNIAYKPVEINGSKMKEILYGINEYE